MPPCFTWACWVCFASPEMYREARLPILTNGECTEEYQLFNNDTQTDAFSWNPPNFFNIHEVLLSLLTDVFKQYPEFLCVQVHHCVAAAWIDCSFTINVYKPLHYHFKATGWFSGAITSRFPAYFQFHHSSTKCVSVCVCAWVCMFADGGICAVTE